MNREKAENFFLPFSAWVFWAPVFAAVVILPLWVRGHFFQIASQFDHVSMTRSGIGLDLFLLGKSRILYGSAIVAVICRIFLIKKEESFFHARKFMIPLVFYLMLSLLSALFALDKKTAFLGGEDMFQGFLATVCYLILMEYVFSLILLAKENGKASAEAFILCFLRMIQALSFLLVILGVLQTMGIEPLSWGFVQKLLIPDGISVGQIEAKGITLTLYNSNYAGVMCGMLAPFTLAGFLFEKNKWLKAAFVFSSAGLIFCLIASQARSTGVIFAVVITGALVAALLGKAGKVRLSSAAVIFIPVLLLIAGFVILIFNPEKFYPLKKYQYDVESFTTDADGVHITSGGHHVTCRWDDGGFEAVNEKGVALKQKAVKKKTKKKMLQKLPGSLTGDQSSFAPFTIREEGFQKIRIFPGVLKKEDKTYQGYVFYVHSNPMFILKRDGEYLYYNYFGKMVSMKDSPDAFPVSLYPFATNRGYIWSKTIPLLQDHFFLGVGADHYSLIFPNDDYAAKLRIKRLDTLYTKPHCGYLKIAAESGVIAMLCMILFFVYMVIKGAACFANSVETADQKEGGILDAVLRLMTLCSIMIYGFTMLLNDEMVVCAPVFWMIAGLHMAMCYKVDR